jgi:hypothetical protein
MSASRRTMLCRSKWIEWTPEMLDQLPGGPDDPLYVKRFLMAKGTRWEPGDMLDIKPDGGFFQVRV